MKKKILLLKFFVRMRVFRIHIVFIIAFAAVISTVFVTDNALWQGVITAKYFWFAAVICVVSLFLPFHISKNIKIHISDILFALFSI